jgi:hypothetical protein
VALSAVCVGGGDVRGASVGIYSTMFLCSLTFQISGCGGMTLVVVITCAERINCSLLWTLMAWKLLQT